MIQNNLKKTYFVYFKMDKTKEEKPRSWDKEIIIAETTLYHAYQVLSGVYGKQLTERQQKIYNLLST